MQTAVVTELPEERAVAAEAETVDSLRRENAALKAELQRLRHLTSTPIASHQSKSESQGSAGAIDPTVHLFGGRANEERLRVALLAGGMGTWTMDLRSRVALLDARARELLGIGAGAGPVSFEHFLSAVHPEDRVLITQAEERQYWQDGRFEAEFRVVRPGGRHVWLASEGSVINDERGVPAISTGVCWDVTERRQARDTLAHVAEQRRLAIDIAEIGTWSYDPSAQLLHWDARCRALFGKGPDCDAVTLDEIAALTHPDDRNRVLAAVAAALDPDGPGDYLAEYRALWSDGTVRWVLANGRVLFSGEGEARRPALFVGTSLDITDRKCSEEAVRESEKRLRQLADCMPQLVWSALPDGKVEYYNRRSERFSGFTYSEETGWGWERPLHPDDVAATSAAWQHCLQTGDDYQVEHRVRMTDGRFRWHLSRAVAVRDERGDVLRWYGTATDIHEQKLTEEALRRNERLFRAAIDHFPSLFNIYDAERRLVYVNSKTVELTGLPEDACIGRLDEEVMPPELTGLYLPALEHVYETRRPDHLEVTLPPELGGTTQIVSLIPVLDEAGDLHHVLAFFIDITDRKVAEEAMREAKEDAEAANRSTGVFLANMSHEIRTPLTGILGFANLLTRITDGRARSYSERIERSGKRLTETLNAVLTLARMEAGRAEMVIEPVEVATEVMEVADLYRTDAVGKGLNFAVHVAPTARRVTATLDRGAFGSIVQNLISNAVKFTNRGHVCVLVDVEAAPTAAGEPGTQVVVQVEDTGLGIAADFLPRLFEPFTQESSGISRTHEGTGLGLSIARQLAEGMGGTIEVQSVKGRGSRFTVRFTADEAATLLPPPAPQSAPEGEQPKGRILVVEDQEDTRILMDVLLDDVGDLTLVSNTRDALQAVDDEFTRSGTAFDLVLVDVNLGDGPDGTDLLRRLREMPQYRTTPIAVITAFALPGDAERYLKQGFDVYLRKPFAAEELLDLTTRMLASQRIVSRSAALLA